MVLTVYSGKYVSDRWISACKINRSYFIHLHSESLFQELDRERGDLLDDVISLDAINCSPVSLPVPYLTSTPSMRGNEREEFDEETYEEQLFLFYVSKQFQVIS